MSSVSFATCAFVVYQNLFNFNYRFLCIYFLIISFFLHVEMCVPRNLVQNMQNHELSQCGAYYLLYLKRSVYFIYYSYYINGLYCQLPKKEQINLAIKNNQDILLFCAIIQGVVRKLCGQNAARQFSQCTRRRRSVRRASSAISEIDIHLCVKALVLCH